MSARIALCDDQALVLRGLSALLSDLGIEIALEAPDAESLLAALPQRPVEVIVSDIRMPGMGGIGLIGALRELGDATPVILLTTAAARGRSRCPGLPAEGRLTRRPARRHPARRCRRNPAAAG